MTAFIASAVACSPSDGPSNAAGVGTEADAAPDVALDGGTCAFEVKGAGLDARYSCAVLMGPGAAPDTFQLRISRDAEDPRLDIEVVVQAAPRVKVYEASTVRASALFQPSRANFLSTFIARRDDPDGGQDFGVFGPLRLTSAVPTGVLQRYDVHGSLRVDIPPAATPSSMEMVAVTVQF